MKIGFKKKLLGNTFIPIPKVQLSKNSNSHLIHFMPAQTNPTHLPHILYFSFLLILPKFLYAKASKYPSLSYTMGSKLDTFSYLAIYVGDLSITVHK